MSGDWPALGALSIRSIEFSEDSQNLSKFHSKVHLRDLEMAKRRKAGGHNTTKGRTEPAVETDSKRIINTFEDVADSEDEFFVNRDKILLDEDPVQKKRRKLAEEGCYPTVVPRLLAW